MSYQDGDDLKTYIPGVGFLVTNLNTAETHMFDVEPEKTEKCVTCGNKDAEPGIDECVDCFLWDV